MAASGRESSSRRLSLPARVNVLLYTEHGGQSSNLLVKPRMWQQVLPKTNHVGADQSTSGATGTPSRAQREPTTSVPTPVITSLGAIPEDTETAPEDQGDHVTQTVAKAGDHLVMEDPAPDGGYGWVIVFASFCCCVIVDGITYTFGLFLSHFVAHFGASKGKTALAGSLLSGCYMMSGPIVSALTNKYGCRLVTICGSIISCIAFLLAAISPDINCLLITYGVLGGIGFGLIYLPAIVSVGYYFTSRRAFATGIAVCGSGVGAFVFAPLCQLALSYYNWRSVLVLQAGIALNAAVFGALMRPLEINAETVDKDEDDNGGEGDEATMLLTEYKRQIPDISLNKERSSSLSVMDFQDPAKDLGTRNGEAGPALNDSAISLSGGNWTPDNVNAKLPTETGHQQQHVGRPAGSLLSPHYEAGSRRGSYQGRFGGKRAISECTQPPLHLLLSSNPVHGFDRTRRKSSIGQSIMVRPLCKKDVFYTGSTHSLHKRPSLISGSRASLSEHRKSVISIPAKDVLDLVNKAPNKCPPGGPEVEMEEKEDKMCSSIIGNMIDISLLKQYPSFALLALSNLFGMMGYYIPFVYIVNFVENHIYDKDMNLVTAENAALVLSLIGITNTLGRVIVGWISDKVTNPETNSPITALFMNNCCVLISGIAVGLIPFTTSFTLVLLVCAIFGTFISAYMALTTIIIADLVGLDRLTNGYGLINCIRGIATILGSPVAGVIYDIAGSYDLTFYTAGLLLIASSIVSFCIPEQFRRNSKEPSKA
ncbi:Monocarboxylate transporter 14 [Halotydeus destructor]|nr:Monocarboxylate transporter 14 [Halotydeus destructor]